MNVKSSSKPRYPDGPVIREYFQERRRRTTSQKRMGTARAVPAAGPVRKPELEVNPGLKPGVSFDPLTLNKSDTPRVLNLQKAPFGFFPKTSANSEPVFRHYCGTLASTHRAPGSGG